MHVVPHVVEEPFQLGGLEITPLPVPHGVDLRPTAIFSRRAGASLLAYLSDCAAVPEPVRARIAGVEVLIIDGLREKPHPTHLTVRGAVEAAQAIGAGKSFLTHQTHEKNHATGRATCPPAGSGLRRHEAGVCLGMRAAVVFRRSGCRIALFFSWDSRRRTGSRIRRRIRPGPPATALSRSRFRRPPPTGFFPPCCRRTRTPLRPRTRPVGLPGKQPGNNAAGPLAASGPAGGGRPVFGRPFPFPGGASLELPAHLLVVYNSQDPDSQSLAELLRAAAQYRARPRVGHRLSRHGGNHPQAVRVDRPRADHLLHLREELDGAAQRAGAGRANG